MELRARRVRVNHKPRGRLLTTGILLFRTVVRPKPGGVGRIVRAGRGKLDLVGGREIEPLQALSTDLTEIRCAQPMAMVDVGSAGCQRLRTSAMGQRGQSCITTRPRCTRAATGCRRS